MASSGNCNLLCARVNQGTGMVRVQIAGYVNNVYQEL